MSDHPGDEGPSVLHTGRRSFARALRASIAAAIGAGVVELLIGSRRGDYSMGDLLGALPVSIGLWGLFGLFFGLAQGVVAAGISTSLPERGAVRGLLRRLRHEPELDRSVAAGLIAFGCAALVEIVLVRGYLLALGLAMSSRRNAALSTALVAAAGLAMLAVAAPALFHAARAVARLVPRPRSVVLVGVGALGLIGAVFVVLGSLDWRVMDFGPYRGLGLYVTLLLAHHVFWGTLGTRRFPRVVTGLAPPRVLIALLVLVGAAFGWSWQRFGGSPRTTRLLAEETGLTRLLLRGARAVADHDHDGYAARLGGGDCNDHDATVNPGAEDIAGDGIDQDCDGADAVQRAAPVAIDRSATPSRTWRTDLNLLVITIDTLRADRLDEARMPRASELAKRSVRFTRAYAQAPNTPRSFPSFLTSRLPSAVKWASRNVNFPVAAASTAGGYPTFFEELAKAGLAPIGVFSHFNLKQESGIATGFTAWENDGALTLHDSNTDISAPRITARVIEKLKGLGKSKQRFALWTHLFEPHSKYMEHAEFPTRSSGMRGLEEKYDGEVSFADKHIGLMLDALRAAGLAENTIVVVMADHGEAFGEHRFAGERMYFHGQTLYDELLRVPLVIHVPGLAPRTVELPTMLIDLGPTLIDLFGAEPPGSMQGRSLVPAMQGAAMSERPVYAELLPAPSWDHKWRVAISGGYKLLDKQSEGSVELFDLAHDPTEQKNLADADASRVRELRALFQRGP